MSHNEAIQDGIRFSVDKYGQFYYYPRCKKCGEEVMTWSYKNNLNYTCQRCKALDYFSDKGKRYEQNFDAKERKFERAVERIKSKAGGAFSNYQHAIETIHEKLHRDKWFDSTEEIMTAIELVRRKVRARHQVQFGRYRADFVLPDDKIVLEIDGILFHTQKTKEKDKARDNLIILALGPEWEVVRITDELVNQNITRLVPAIRRIKKSRKMQRNYNNGLLPEWYSESEI